VRVSGTALFLTSARSGVPTALLHNLKHNKVLHERVIILNVLFLSKPYVVPESRLEIEEIGQDFYRISVRYGFMDEIDIPLALAKCPCGMALDLMDTTFFFSRENVIPTRGEGMMVWREHLYAMMARNAANPMTFFKIPPNRVVELGTQLNI
jgi:KUP system potassium uptake protein